MTYRRLSIPLLFAWVLLAASGPLHGADLPATRPGAARQAASQPADGSIAVAVLDFTSTSAGNPDLGRQVGEVLAATLSGEPGIQLVDRTSMDKIVQEHQLNLSGVVDSGKAIKTAKLVGAKLIITGQVLAIDKEIFITAKIIGTETSLCKVVIVRGPVNADMADLILQISQKAADTVRAEGPGLLPNKAAIDPLPALKARLAGRKLPSVCVSITERHLNPAAPPARDPAAETEVKNVLVSAGFTVIDSRDEAELDKAGVELAVTGEAFSEFNGKIGNLVSCSGRVEVKVTRRNGHEVLLAEEATARAVDLAENLAAKTALQKAGHELAIKLIRHFADLLPK